jgi:hypothetical protein
MLCLEFIEKKSVQPVRSSIVRRECFAQRYAPIKGAMKSIEKRCEIVCSTQQKDRRERGISTLMKPMSL